MTHNTMAPEQWHVAGVSELAHRRKIGLEVYDGLAIARKLHIHQHRLNPRSSELVYSSPQRFQKLLYALSANRFHGASLQNDEAGIHGNDLAIQALRCLLRRLAPHREIDDLDVRRRESLGERCGDTSATR